LRIVDNNLARNESEKSSYKKKVEAKDETRLLENKKILRRSPLSDKDGNHNPCLQE